MHENKTRIVILTLCVTFAAGTVGSVLLPVVIGSFARQGISSNMLGMFGFLEAGGNAIGSLICSALVKRYRAAAMCMVGAVLSSGSNFLCAFEAGHLDILLAGRACAGIGGGLMFAGALVEVVKIDPSGRPFGWMTALTAGLGVAGYTMGPHLATIASGRGVFFIGALFSFAALAALFLSRRSIASAEAAERPVIEALSRKGLGGSAAVALVAATFLCFAIGQSSLWDFIIPLAASNAMPMTTASYIIVAGNTLQIAAAATAGLIVARIGLGFGIFASLALLILCSIGLVLASAPLLIGAGMILRLCAVALASPLLLMLFGRADPSGRALAVAGAAAYVGYAIGPLTAGRLVDLQHQQFFNLGWFASFAFVICGCLSAVLLRIASKGLEAAPSA